MPWRCNSPLANSTPDTHLSNARALDDQVAIDVAAHLVPLLGEMDLAEAGARPPPPQRLVQVQHADEGEVAAHKSKSAPR